MPRPWRQRAAATWVAVVIVLAIAVAVFARVEVFHKAKTLPSAANTSVRLGPGSARVSKAATAATPGSTASAVAVGDYSTCALLSGSPGGVDCWGDGAHGQLGDGTKETSLVPIEVTSLPGATVGIAAGGSHACAVARDGTLGCWGANTHGQLGNGTTAGSAKPVLARGLTGVVAVAAGAAHTCALVRTGGVDCWGANGSGQLGDGVTTDSSTPQQVQGLQGGVAAIAAGLAHTCGLLSTGTVLCWGSNANGELGDGKMVDSNVPVPVTGLPGPAIAIAAGDAHTCALLEGGAVACWGWNIEGQLGNGGDDSSTPVQVGGIRTATAISAGGNDTCALLRSGAVVCWGANLDGQLGNGGTSDSSTPVVVSGLGNGAAAISTGLSHSCALLMGGSTTCWGANAHGELGDGTTTSSSTPVNVTGLGLSPDGSGTIAVSPPVLASGTKSATVSFTYTAAPGGTLGGVVAVEVPPGWSRPSTQPAAPGSTTATAGHLSVAGRTIRVAGLTLATGHTVTIVYGRGAGARAAATGGVWKAEEQSSVDGALVLLKPQPAVSVLAADGSGALTARTHVVPSGAANRTIRFVYTAAGAVDGGRLELTVPQGWSRPTKLSTVPGFTTASKGTLSIAGQKITVGDLKLGGDGTLTVVYRGKAPAGDVGTTPWDAREQSGAGGKLRPLSSPPAVTILSPDGSGQMSVNTTTVANGAKGVTLTFMYTAGKGGIKGGELSLFVPPGWSAPTTKPKSAGYVSSLGAKVTVVGRIATVPVKELGGGASLSITYAGATAPKGLVGEQNWVTFERSTHAGKAKPIAQPAQVTVLSPDGSGTLARASGPVTAGSQGNTVVWVFTAAKGGMSGGALELTVPAGWSAPSTNPKDPGYVTASPGTVAANGQAIMISGLSLPSGGIVTITYGSRAGGGAGASAPGGAETRAWQAQEQSSASGSLVAVPHSTRR
jgi:alpha-tubulin suppressor-like RCC1 family protein